MNQSSPTPSTAQPSPTPSILQAPPPDSLQTVGAILGIAFAVIAAVLGYRILRGGKGL